MIIQNKVKTKSKKIIGRGYGSGKGSHTASRGNKGQKSRAGSHIPRFFEGGQNSLIHRLPYLKGEVRHREKIDVINLDFLDKYFDENAKIDIEILKDKGFVKSSNVKILARGDIKKPLEIISKNITFSAKAYDKIIKAKGKIS
ncbi:50S ribosomal protein L15 [Patescibacteria group bacterium]|nr:50S ribosomal protein L15 [Patescibacteria group bacterium]